MAKCWGGASWVKKVINKNQEKKKISKDTILKSKHNTPIRMTNSVYGYCITELRTAIKKS